MASEWSIPQQGYVMAGHVDSLREAREAAAQWLRAAGSSNFEAEQLTEQAPVVHAWWSEPLGVFVQVDHADAEPVTVVSIPV